jgi:hypothetical protein
MKLTQNYFIFAIHQTNYQHKMAIESMFTPQEMEDISLVCEENPTIQKLLSITEGLMLEAKIDASSHLKNQITKAAIAVGNDINLFLSGNADCTLLLNNKKDDVIFGRFITLIEKSPKLFEMLEKSKNVVSKSDIFASDNKIEGAMTRKMPERN